MYSGQNGGDCGNFEGRVTGVYNSGFTMDFSFDNNFNNNYREEMVYYRAFNFQIAPPQADQIWFTNHPDNMHLQLRQTSVKAQTI